MAKSKSDRMGHDEAVEGKLHLIYFHLKEIHALLELLVAQLATRSPSLLSRK